MSKALQAAAALTHERMTPWREAMAEAGGVKMGETDGWHSKALEAAAALTKKRLSLFNEVMGQAN